MKTERMTQEMELLACPFCGKIESAVYTNDLMAFMCDIELGGCGANGPMQRNAPLKNVITDAELKKLDDLDEDAVDRVIALRCWNARTAANGTGTTSWHRGSKRAG